MSYGNCCLASDIPENLEALAGCGHTFKSKDPASLADKLDYLIKNPEVAESLKDRAREHVLTNHSWDNIANMFERFYLGLIEGKSA